MTEPHPERDPNERSRTQWRSLGVLVGTVLAFAVGGLPGLIAYCVLVAVVGAILWERD